MPGETKSVFLSHSSRDKTLVNRLVARLREAGVSEVWYDVIELGPDTADLNADIRSGIAKADCFVYVLSEASQASPWVIFEIREAIEHDKMVLVLVVAGEKSHYEFLRNPFINELLRGGRRKIIDLG